MGLHLPQMGAKGHQNFAPRCQMVAGVVADGSRRILSALKLALTDVVRYAMWVNRLAYEAAGPENDIRK
jgi:hypothetical protein